MKYSVATLSGVLLDAAVALAEGLKLPEGWDVNQHLVTEVGGQLCTYHPSGNETQAAVIIDREHICSFWDDDIIECWTAEHPAKRIVFLGDTRLEAAMRAHVHNRFGLHVELPV